jgi:TonB family protein
MRCHHLLISLAAVALAGTAAGRPPAERVGEWTVQAFRAGECSAQRDYPGGTRISVSSSTSGVASLSVLNRDWPMQSTGPYRIVLVQDGARKSFAAEANPFLHGLGVATPRGPSLLAQLDAGGTLEVLRSDGIVLERVDLGGIAPALARLGPCRRDVATRANFPPVAAPPPPPRPSGSLRPSRTPVPLPSLFSSADYPAAAIRAGETGLVVFRLDVGEDGRVAACTVTASSGSASLDSTTCRLVKMRARFDPARDAEGRPVPDSFVGRVLWRLPEPPPPPRPKQ